MNHTLLNEPKLITNQNGSSFYQELVSSLRSCNQFYFSVAFINYSGLQLLLDVFKDLSDENISGKILTSTYLNFTDVKSLRKLNEFSNIESKIFKTKNQVGFHTKAFIFEYENEYKIIIGSSNITQSALKSNVEWNVQYISKKQSQYALNVLKEFQDLWNQSDDNHEDFQKQYEDYINNLQTYLNNQKHIFNYTKTIEPNSMQTEALDSLNKLRKNNQNKALIIAATGTGKTYLSAFDIKQMQAKRVLFVAHRERILNDAMRSFNKVMPDVLTTIFQGSKKETQSEITFAMIQTISKPENLQLFSEDTFDYVVYDEAHRSFSPTYQKVMKYFNPEFTLGMTATPERTDGGNIFELFNNNIALEVRLRDALKEDLVTPFHYFGITDATTNLSDIDVSEIDILAERLSIKSRVDLVIEKLLHYGFSGLKRKALGFCVSKKHAHFMADEFNAFGYCSLALTGESSNEEREKAIQRLEDQNDPLEFIFTIDIFNEGVDIPSINLVLMLRPTQSPIIFTQQLGRGLRKYEYKDFLTVLDFIGNHNKSFLIPIALSGSRYYDRDTLKVTVSKDFNDIPGCTHIHLDKIVKDQILNQLDRVNFNKLEYLKKEYLEFKNVLGDKPTILDYIKYENAPDPIKFILKENSYVEFQYKVEKETMPPISMDQVKVLQVIDKMLPIKRIHEFILLKLLFLHGQVSYETIKSEIIKIIPDVDEASMNHSISFFKGDMLGPNELNPFPFISYQNNGFLTLNIKLEEWIKEAIIHSLDYGIIRYQEEFGKHALPYPFLKLYSYYKMKDLGFLTNYEKSFASIREGVWKNGQHYYLFVDLHKGEDIKASINYKDKLTSKRTMQWETQNKTPQHSDTGMDLCYPKKRNIHLHMFLRKAKMIGNQKLDYIYVGEVNPTSFEGNKPITIQFDFIHELPQHIFDDLTLIIDNKKTETIS